MEQSFFGVLAIAVAGIFFVNAALKRRREKKDRQLRAVQAALREHLNKSGKTKRSDRNEDLDMAELRASLSAMIEQHLLLKESLARMEQEMEDRPIFRIDRSGAAKHSPAVFRSGRTGLPVDPLH